MMHQARASLLSHPLTWRSVAIASVLLVSLSGCADLRLGGAQGDGVRGGYKAGGQVALLLPIEGPLRGVSDAVRAGARAAADVDDPKSRPKLESVDSGPPDQVSTRYGQALDAGATYVIGPIDKPSVDALAARGALPVPTLALNEGTSAGKPTPNLFQFSLSPETDAIEVANKAKSLGFTRALMLYPDDAAGNRRAQAFRDHWGRIGGAVVGEATFSPSAVTTPAKMQGLLAKGNVDFLFLVANAEQARVIYPQIRTDAADLPVMATSDVYNGDADPARDRALDGLYFVDMPWMLNVEKASDPLNRAKLQTSASYLATPLGRRLYAMGIDAYRLVPRLTALAGKPGSAYTGQTGRLSLDAMGRVRRELTLARFTDSGPQVVAGRETRRWASPWRSPRPESTKGRSS
jgi:hypothetical protein